MTRARRGGFTLIEVLAVLAVLALLATVAGLSLREPIAEARRQLATEQLILADQLGREFAIRHELPIGMQCDLRRGQYVRLETGRQHAEAVLAGGLDISEVWLHGKFHRSGTVEWVCRPDGSSPTYALRIGTHRPTWVMFAGGTGQVEVFDDEASAKSTLESLVTRVHAD